MLVLRSVALFLLAALAEIGGAWLVWQGVREQRGPTRVLRINTAAKQGGDPQVE